MPHSKNKQKRVCFCLLVFWPGPKTSSSRGVCTKDLTGWEGAGQSMCQEIQRLCCCCDPGLLQKWPSFDNSLDRSHPRSFLAGIELQESWQQILSFFCLFVCLRRLYFSFTYEGNFTGYGVPGCWFCFFQREIFPSTLFLVSEGKSDVTIILVPLQVGCSFPPHPTLTP